MKTTAQTLHAKVYVYARAKTPHQLENLQPGELPYTFDVKDYDYGDEKSVRILEFETDIPIPAGIDITAKCIENLKEQINAANKAHQDLIEDLNDRIRNLALIEHHPEPNDAGASDDGIIISGH